MKLNVLLASTDALKTKFKNMVNDYTVFFTKSQGSFTGEKTTYEPREGTIDDPGKRGFRRVVTTVDEKFEYFLKESEEFINSLFSQERTNAMGIAQADLIVGGKSWGMLTSLELLRLKSLLESADLGNIERMFSVIPVRKEDVVWKITTELEYQDREIWETEMIKGVTKTTEKESYILPDPNVQAGNVKGSYNPQIAVKTTVKELGDFTHQKFSGEWSHRQRAMVLKRRNDLLIAVIKALKECNECESEKSDLTAEKLFGYLLGK